MKTETIEDEILYNGSRKIVLGVRCFPELKNKLTQEAIEVGITLSEHCENILLNKDILKEENENTKRVIENLNQKILKLENLLNISELNLKEEIEDLLNENNQLKKEVAMKDDQLTEYVKAKVNAAEKPALNSPSPLFDRLLGKKTKTR